MENNQMEEPQDVPGATSFRSVGPSPTCHWDRQGYPPKQYQTAALEATQQHTQALKLRQLGGRGVGGGAENQPQNLRLSTKWFCCELTPTSLHTYLGQGVSH